MSLRKHPSSAILTAIVLLGGIVFTSTGNAATFDHEHHQWTALLSKHVIAQQAHSNVQYSKLKRQHSEVKRYLESLRALSFDEFSSFSVEERLAFLLNTYNAFTVDLVLQHYPLTSLKELEKTGPSAWERPIFELFGKARSLNQIENEMIRLWFNEPRIHFALNCAARGCPRLLNQAYVASHLEQQLAEATKTFLSDTARNRYQAKGGILELSTLFKWYSGDFTKKGNSIQQFVQPYITTVPKNAPRTIEVRYLPYDWRLNDAPVSDDAGHARENP